MNVIECVCVCISFVTAILFCHQIYLQSVVTLHDNVTLPRLICDPQPLSRYHCF